MSAPEPTPHRAGANDTQSPVQSVPAPMQPANLLGGEPAVSAAAPVLPPVSFPTNDERQGIKKFRNEINVNNSMGGKWVKYQEIS